MYYFLIEFAAWLQPQINNILASHGLLQHDHSLITLHTRCDPRQHVYLCSVV